MLFGFLLALVRFEQPGAFVFSPQRYRLPNLQGACAKNTRALVLCHVWRGVALVVGDSLISAGLVLSRVGCSRRITRDDNVVIVAVQHVVFAFLTNLGLEVVGGLILVDIAITVRLKSARKAPLMLVFFEL